MAAGTYGCPEAISVEMLGLRAALMTVSAKKNGYDQLLRASRVPLPQGKFENSRPPLDSWPLHVFASRQHLICISLVIYLLTVIQLRRTLYLLLRSDENVQRVNLTTMIMPCTILIPPFGKLPLQGVQDPICSHLG